MQNRETRKELAAALARAPYPIRNGEDLGRALPAGARVRAGEVCLGAARVRDLPCPRDFLFTGATQVADLVATRACFAHASDPLH